MRGRGLAQLGDGEAVGLGAVLHRFLAPRERLGDALQRLALLGEIVEGGDLLLLPGLAVALERFAHDAVPTRSSGSTARTSIASSRPLKSAKSPAAAPI